MNIGDDLDASINGRGKRTTIGEAASINDIQEIPDVE
jgi:hypothetical protein